jgi:hypothetical protein
VSNGTVPPGDRLRRAIAWITDERAARPHESAAVIVGEAAMRFNLSPAEEEWLLQTLRSPPAK